MKQTWIRAAAAHWASVRCCGKNGWPVAGDNFKEGTYEIESERRGYALELTVDFVRMPGRMRGFVPQ
jgi:hypothetical protein